MGPRLRNFPFSKSSVFSYIRVDLIHFLFWIWSTMYEIIHNTTIYVWFAHLSTQLDFYVAMLPTSEVAHPAAYERSTSSTPWNSCWATQNPLENLYDACLDERFARHQKKHRRSWSSWKRQKSNVVSKILGFRSGIKSHTSDSRLPDLLVRVCGVIVQLPGSRRLCWAWCSSTCPDQRWLLVAWGSQIGAMPPSHTGRLQKHTWISIWMRTTITSI